MPDLLPKQFCTGAEGEAVKQTLQARLSTQPTAVWTQLFRKPEFDACVEPGTALTSTTAARHRHRHLLHHSQSLHLNARGSHHRHLTLRLVCLVVCSAGP